jgi:hypothetical protein
VLCANDAAQSTTDTCYNEDFERVTRYNRGAWIWHWPPASGGQVHTPVCTVGSWPPRKCCTAGLQSARLAQKEVLIHCQCRQGAAMQSSSSTGAAIDRNPRMKMHDGMCDPCSRGSYSCQPASCNATQCTTTRRQMLQHLQHVHITLCQRASRALRHSRTAESKTQHCKKQQPIA